MLVDALRGTGPDHPDAPVFVQSFDPASLRMLRMDLRVRQVQLVDDDSPHLVAPESLPLIAEYADVVGAHKSVVIPRTETGTLGAPGPPVDDAHALGLAVHAFTVRDENAFLPPAATAQPSASRSSRRASTGCSPTTRTPPSRCATGSLSGG